MDTLVPLPAPISAYRFFAKDSPATVKGYLVDAQGVRVGASILLGLSANTLAPLSADLPRGAVGAVAFALTGTVAYAPGDDAADLAAHPDRFPYLPAFPLALGQVSAPDVNALAAVSATLEGTSDLAQDASVTALTSALTTNLGLKADTAATDNTSAFSLIALFKRLLARVGGVYYASPSNLTDGVPAPVLTDIKGRTMVYNAMLQAGEDQTNDVQKTVQRVVQGSTYSWTTSTSFGAAVTQNVRVGPGQLMAIRATNANTAARWLQLHNVTGTPSAGATPAYSWLLPLGSATNPTVLEVGASLLGPNGLPFTTGIAWAISTAQATYVTGATASDHNVYVSVF